MLNNRMTAIMVGFLALVVGLSLWCFAPVTEPTAEAAAESAKSLDVPRATQQQSNWCWATSGLMIAQYYHRNSVGVTECAVVQAIVGIGCPNVAATDSQVTQTLGWFGFAYSKASGAPTMTTVKAQIDASQPMGYDYAYVSASGKHVVVVTGYYFDVNGSGSVYWNDPADDLNKGSNYAAFVSNSTWTASFTVLNIK